MIFGIDFDGTYAADPDSFEKMVNILEAAGHTCILVTQRGSEYALDVEEVIKDGMTVVYASGFTKLEAAMAAGYSVDVWIDDNPYSIFTPLTYIGATNGA